MAESLPQEFAPVEARTVKTVAITGASAGIGLALAQQFAAAGYEVAVIGRDKGRTAAAAADNPRLHPFVLDVVDAAACLHVFAEIEAQIGPVDALVANAAIYPKVHFLDQSPESFSDTMRINVDGVANSVRAVLPGMLARNLGRIVVIGSEADYNPIPASLAYSASKGALHAFVRGLANEIDPNHYPNVLINEVSPGATRTSMSEGGQPPEAVFPYVRALIDLPSGGHTGQYFRRDQLVHLGETWKGTIKRKLLGKGR